MKTFGLFVLIASVLPLAACERRDRCDNGGWCDGTTPTTYYCYRDRDCPPNNYCDQQGACVPIGPVPPGRAGAGAGGSITGVGGSHGTGGFPGSHDGGVDVMGTGGSHQGSGGETGTVDGGSSTGGSTGAGGEGGHGMATGGSSGTGGAVVPPGDAGAPHTCGTDGGPACRPHPTPVCQFDHDCGLTGRCVDGECQSGCTASSDCGTGQVCTAGYCTASTTSGGQCVFNSDCSGSATCINGYCHADCTTNANCQGHDVCVSGICQPNSGPQPQCRANADCVGVHVTEDVCVDAVCRTPCISDTDCCDGSSGTVCQMGYCLTAHEVAPQCHVSTDCAAAQTCIDATCE